MNDHTLKYEKKKQDYTKFWKEFKKPLQGIHTELKNKNKLQAETNKIFREIRNLLRRKW